MTHALPDRYWSDLVTVALLGTDRRDPPEPPAGVLADLIDDTLHEAPSQRMLAAVSAGAAARRAAFVADPPCDRPAPPEPDPRPVCPAAAASTWKYVVAEWPVLEDEWVLTVIERGIAAATRRGGGAAHPAPHRRHAARPGRDRGADRWPGG